VYAHVVKRAVAWTAVVIPARDVDRIGLHKANIEGMRRAVAALGVRPAYVLTDGFAVAGFGTRGLGVWKGDRVAACIAAASVVAKVTRDRLMVAMHDDFPVYGFADHKGYITPEHQDALAEHGPCEEHRRSFINVRRAGAECGREAVRIVDLGDNGHVNGDVNGDVASDLARAVELAELR
jgi:ribonuclease HII